MNKFDRAVEIANRFRSGMCFASDYADVISIFPDITRIVEKVFEMEHISEDDVKDGSEGSPPKYVVHAMEFDKLLHSLRTEEA